MNGYFGKGSPALERSRVERLPVSNRVPRKPRRPSIENERFWTLPDASLRFIAKDAYEAAHAMRGLDAAAECKYLDQINDAATVLAWRQRNPNETE